MPASTSWSARADEEEKLVRVVLSQAGLSHQQIEGFLKAAIKQQ